MATTNNNAYSEEDLKTQLANAYNQTLANLDVNTDGSVEQDIFINVPVTTYYYPRYQEIQRTALLTSLDNASLLSNSDMDLLAANYGCTRIADTNASGILTFYTSSISADINIPVGVAVSTVSGITFVTTETKTIYASNAILYFSVTNNRYEINVNAQAVLTGTSSNVDANTITVLVSNVQSITGVVNYAPFSGGAITEDNVSLAARCKETWIARELNTPTGITGALTSNFSSVLKDYLAVTKGSPDMVRDEGLGGKLDLYVLTGIVSEASEYLFVTSAALLYPTNPILPIVIPNNKPVTALLGAYLNGVQVSSTSALLAQDVLGVNAHSTRSYDYIYFTASSGIVLGNYVVVKYNYNNKIIDMQNYYNDAINQTGSLDVLVKEGTEVDATINLSVKSTNGVDWNTLETNIYNTLTTWGTTFKFGVNLQASQIITQVEALYGVADVNKDSIVITATNHTQDYLGNLDVASKEYIRIINVLVTQFT